jgi:hypothetical protein
MKELLINITLKISHPISGVHTGGVFGVQTPSQAKKRKKKYFIIDDM